jgi:hypothetical protein
MTRLRLFLILYAIFILGAAFRLYNVNWDSGYHMHPDERAIILSVITLSPPTSFEQFFSAESPWNPKFFAYGSLPFYLLFWAGKVTGQLINPQFSTYDGIQIIGRYLSAIFDLGTLLWIFLIGKRLFRQAYALLAVFFYALSTLPIQLSHFYAVDTLLTFFITGTLYLLLRYIHTPDKKLAILIGFFFGSALATKMSALTLLIPIGISFLWDMGFVLSKHRHHPEEWGRRTGGLFPRILLAGVIFTAIAFVTFFMFQPYAFFDYQTFTKHTLEQSQLTRDPYAFPFTLQYVGKIPYLYELKNIFLYGMGPLLGLVSLVGIILYTVMGFIKQKSDAREKELILLSFFWVYFLLVGHFAVGFMRYMLPVYPIFCLAAAYFVNQLVTFLQKKIPQPLLAFGSWLLALSLFMWPLSFLQIYTRPNTRIQATTWIHQFIPPGRTLAIEHWDDALPMTGQDRYRTLTLTLYDADTPEKWQIIRNQLRETDYIILASNRLYTPLMKLTDCQHPPPGRCYPETAKYYQKLFNGSLGFSKVAEITSYPTIPFTKFTISDQDADESFTVYDHPRIMIFKKITR